jgi:mono/diheme cytochrome c family protein
MRRRALGRAVLTAAFAMLLWSVVGPISLPAASPGSSPVEEGGKLFQQTCTSCHTVGQGDRVGPDLKDVTARRERDWLIRFLLEPDKMHAEKDPIAAELLEKYKMPMPNLGLTRDQAESLIAYLESLSGTKAPGQQAAQAPALPKGDPALGKALFTGERRFQNGGPSCMACHNAADLGAPGGTLGPDLTQVYHRYREEGLASALETIPFPTMQPVYRAKPLTPEERAHLIAFFKQITTEAPPGADRSPILLAGLGAAVLLGLAQIVWRRRLTDVHRSIAKGGKA